MTVAPLRPCAYPNCRTLVVRGRCPTHAVLVEATRVNVDVRRWYRTARWARLRRVVLADQPICPPCRAAGRVVATTDVDHVRPHCGDPGLFWDPNNLQALCHVCHTNKTNRGE
jgi:5-methylcytosine-specific restriction enzyme A